MLFFPFFADPYRYIVVPGACSFSRVIGIFRGDKFVYLKGLARLRDEVGPANRASHVRPEPHVDALGVEHVVALGDEPQGVLVLEFVQAHGALERALPELLALDRGVFEGREGVDHLGVEAAQGRPPPQGAGGAERADAARGPGGGAVAEVDGEEAHQEEGRDEDHDYDGHGRSEVGVGVLRRRGLRRYRRREKQHCQQQDENDRTAGVHGHDLLC